MSKRRNSAAWERQLEDFFASPLAEKAGSFLSKKALIALHIDAHHTYLFQRREGRNQVRIVKDPAADVHFFVPLSTMRYLLDLGAQPTSGIGTMGVAVVEYLFHHDPEKKIRFRVDTGFLQLVSRGYFSVLKAGGPEVASYLAQWGYGSLSRLKDLIKQVRN